MPTITFYFNGNYLASAEVKERSNQTDRDKIAKRVLSSFGYQAYDEFALTEDNGEGNGGVSTRRAFLTPYFQDAQGRIWKAEWSDDV